MPNNGMRNEVERFNGSWVSPRGKRIDEPHDTEQAQGVGIRVSISNENAGHRGASV